MQPKNLDQQSHQRRSQMLVTVQGSGSQTAKHPATNHHTYLLHICVLHNILCMVGAFCSSPVLVLSVLLFPVATENPSKPFLHQ